jgi:putative ABC transport system permease protein
MIITESVVLTTVSGYVGLLIGTGLIALVNYLISASGGGAELFKNPEIEPQIALGALLILIVSGAIAGLLPARYAVKIQPVEALRAD